MAGKLQLGLIAMTLAATLPAAALLLLEAMTAAPLLSLGASGILGPRIGLVGGILGFSLVLAWVSIGRFVMRPLGRLQAGAARLRDGHLDEQIHTQGMPHDFADVGRSLNTMALKLRIIQDGMEQMVRARTAELRASEARFRTIVTTVRDHAIFMLDTNGRILTWNEGATALHGYEPDEVLGRSFEVFYMPEEREAGVPRRALADARAAGSLDFEGWRLRKDGRRIWADIVITALYDEGRLLGFVEVARDLTERRAMEEDLRRSNRDLEQFAYSASHDLRQPARTVSAYLDLISNQGVQDPEMVHYITRAAAAAERMQSLIDGILAYSRASRAPPARSSVSPRQLLEEVQDDLAPLLEEHDAALDVAEMPPVYVDPDHLRIVFQNLLTNAIQYRAPSRPPEIRVGASRENSWVRISFSDNGIGIAPRHHGKVFEMFQRLHTRDVHAGHGIGLALVKRVIEANHGHVDVRSEEGAGATFNIWLPAPFVAIGAPRPWIKETRPSLEPPQPHEGLDDASAPRVR